MQDPHHQTEQNASDQEATSGIEPSVSPDDRNDDSAETNPPWSSEPFRAFFPLGVAAAILGAAIWPLFYAGWWHSPVPLQHPRLMIFGFGVAFVTGFLGTAWPRFVEAPAMRRWELISFVLLWFAAQVAWLFNRYQAGDLLLTAQLLGLIAFLLHRAKIGDDRPPVGLWIAFLGPAIGFFAVFASATNLSPLGLQHPMLRLLVWQGMLLLPLMGVGTIFFPRLFPKPDSNPAGRTGGNTAIWMTALLLIVSLLVEAAAWVRIGNGLRFVAVLWWAWIACPIIVRGPAPSTRAWALRVGLGSIASSFLIRAIWPGPGFAMEHLLFIAGFGLTMTLVAERVTLGHADCAPGPEVKSKGWRWLACLLLIAASTRMSADLKDSLIVSHHRYAALIWIGVLVAWAVPLLRHWRSQPTP